MDPGFASFDKLQEVGVSPYLCFIPILSVFRCFGWLEALNGHLIGPKAWDRIDLILLTQYEMVVTAQKLVGCLCGNFALKCMLDMKKCREWAVDRSQNMGPNYGNFFGHLGQSVPETDVGCYVGIYALNSILVSIRPEMGKKFGSKK